MPRRITVVGAGVVGMASAAGLRGHGHDVRLVDIDASRVAHARADGWEAATPDETDWAASEITMISVSTPTHDGEVRIQNVLRAVETVGDGLRGSSDPHLVVLRSTVPPGTTTGPVRRILLERSGRRLGEDLSLAHNPEFLRQASAADDFAHPWLTVFGVADPRAAGIMRELYEPFDAPIIETTCTTSETIKYAHNLYNATKISFFNEFHLVCERLGIDSELVGSTVVRSAEASWNPAYGSHGGRPYGGACLPKDTTGFLSFARSLGLEMPLLAGTIEVNTLLGGEAVAPTTWVPVMAEDARHAPHLASAAPMSFRPQARGEGDGEAARGVDAAENPQHAATAGIHAAGARRRERPFRGGALDEGPDADRMSG